MADTDREARRADTDRKPHSDPGRSSGHGADAATRTPKGGASQDSFGQSGRQDPATQTDHNARPGR